MHVHRACAVSKVPWRCRWFGHDFRDPITGTQIHVYIESMAAPPPGTRPRCVRCGAVLGFANASETPRI